MFIPIQHRNGRWHEDFIRDRPIIEQLRREAGLHNHPWPDPPDAYDRILRAAGNHGLGLTTQIQEQP